MEKNVEFDTSVDALRGATWSGSPPERAGCSGSSSSSISSCRSTFGSPTNAPTVGAVGDLGLGAQLLLCCGPEGPLDYLSIRADVAAPTGSLRKGIDGTGSWSVSLLPARRFTILQRLPDLMVQMQLAYSQDIKPTRSASDGGIHQKTFVWNSAFTQQYLAGRIRPVFEVLGTTVVDAASAPTSVRSSSSPRGCGSPPSPTITRSAPSASVSAGVARARPPRGHAHGCPDHRVVVRDLTVYPGSHAMCRSIKL